MKTPFGGFPVKCAAVCLAVAMAAVSSHAQTVAWTQRIVSGPTARFEHHAMAYDSARGMTVLFGGVANGSSYNGETWEWNGATWTQRTGNGPSPRRQQAMAYDATRGVTVLFGGVTSDGTNGDTWEWDGTVWTQRNVSGPSARLESAMVYDSARAVAVLFGGQAADLARNGETWEWNGTVWTQRGNNGPSPRSHHAMSYDAARGVTVLFGGYFTDGSLGSDTWEWNGTIWTQRMVPGPSPRVFHAMAYDSARGVTVLFGGADVNGVVSGDTWEWNGSVWTQRALSGPSPRGLSAMAYDSARAVAILFGGYNGISNGETWELGDPCPLPRITQQPAPASVLPATTAAFSVMASSTASLAYQWRRNGQPLANAPTGTGSVTTGVDTPTLTISYASYADNGSAFDCVVSNSCGSKQSNPAGLAVGPRCRADFNANGATEVADIFAFLNAWFAGCP